MAKSKAKKKTKRAAKSAARRPAARARKKAAARKPARKKAAARKPARKKAAPARKKAAPARKKAAPARKRAAARKPARAGASRSRSAKSKAKGKKTTTKASSKRTAAEKKAGGPEAARPPERKPRSRRRSSRRASPTLRRGPDGELLAPGELLLPKGPKNHEEIHYLLRGCVAADRSNGANAGVAEIVEKAPGPDPEAQKADLSRLAEHLAQRFESGSIEAYLPTRPPVARNFAGVIERAGQRRREIGAFLRGLDLGGIEAARMDPHGEASLQSLMEWAARLEKLMEAEEPQQSDFAQFHRGLDQLEHTTEALLVDVELTLRRLGGKHR